MQAVTAPASTRTQALDIIVRRFARPVGLEERLTEAGDAMLICDVLSDLETAFGIHLDDFWKPATIDQLADLVVERVTAAMVAATTPPADVIDLAAQRAHRTAHGVRGPARSEEAPPPEEAVGARTPMFPTRPTFREERAFARRSRRDRNRAAWAFLIAAAIGCGALAAGVYWALEHIARTQGMA